MNDYYTALQMEGWTIVPAACPNADEWAAAILAVVESGGAVRIDRPASYEERFLDEGGAYHHWTLDTEALVGAVPSIVDWYERTCEPLSLLFDREVITSPYPKSALTGKVYGRPGDCQGWHRDTNPVTALLCLTEVDGDWGTTLVDRHGDLVHVQTQPGDLAVFYGRELRHYVPPLPFHTAPRVTIPANYYHPDDTWRPDGIDSLVYGTE